jgi:ABC-type Fe3+/spermidine/putrescine transport system ATPase subunit
MEVVFKNVTKRYGKTVAVENLNLTIETGALHFLLGPSGCGKTTTLRMLAGLESVTEGQILFDGRDVTRSPAADRGIGMVFQNYALWPHMTVLKNIEYGLKLRKISKNELNERVQEVLQITQLVRFADRLPGQLSGGQQQRVALARALAIRPNVLLLDEPLSNLDAKLRHEMRDNICRIHKQTGITTVYVTHDQKEALSMGTKISVMHSGSLIQSASPRELYNHPESPFVAGFIGETNLIAGTYSGVDTKNSRADQHVVQTDLGLIRSARKFGNFKSGDKVIVSIRPESIELDLKSPRYEVNTYDVTLNHLTYLGESEQLLLNKGDTLIRATLFNSQNHGLTDGDGARIRFPENAPLILSPDQLLGAGT